MARKALFEIFARCDAYPELCAEIRKAPATFYEWRRRAGDTRWDQAFGQVAPDKETLLERLANQARVR